MLNLSDPTIRQLSINKSFGCLTRNAFEFLLDGMDWRNKCILYFDIDNLKTANNEYGKAGVNERIKDSISFRATDIAQWFSGDEFVAVVSIEDVLGFARRIQKELHSRGLSATFIILTNSTDIDRAETLVSEGKRFKKDSIYLI
jgi:GGDEF domain-containing protein